MATRGGKQVRGPQLTRRRQIADKCSFLLPNALLYSAKVNHRRLEKNARTSSIRVINMCTDIEVPLWFVRHDFHSFWRQKIWRHATRRTIRRDGFALEISPKSVKKKHHTIYNTRCTGPTILRIADVTQLLPTWALRIWWQAHLYYNQVRYVNIFSMASLRYLFHCIHAIKALAKSLSPPGCQSIQASARYVVSGVRLLTKWQPMWCHQKPPAPPPPPLPSSFRKPTTTMRLFMSKN